MTTTALSSTIHRSPRPMTARGRRTCAAIVEAAAELIYARGVAATSLDQVLERSGAGKSQLYHYFPAGKRDLVGAVVERQLERVFADQPRLSRIETWADLEAWAGEAAAHHRAAGGPFRCPLGSLAAELDRDPELRPVIAAALQRWLAPLREAALRLRERGELSSSTDPAHVAERILGALQGAMMLARALEDPAVVERALQTALVELARV